MNNTQRILLYAVPWEFLAFVMLVAVVLLAEQMRSRKKKRMQTKNGL
jgi:hypothetical protein